MCRTAGWKYRSIFRVRGAIQSLLAFLSCSLTGKERHPTWIDRLPSVLWTLNSSVCAATGYSPFYLDHDQEPRGILSRALDTASVPKASQPWAVTLKARLEAASQLAKTVSTFDRDNRQHVASLPRQARRAPPTFSVGDSVYYHVERFSRDTADGMKLVPTWTGPFVVRCPVAGSQHRYLIARTETSATIDAHVVRLKPAPARTYGVVALESHAADGQGAGRGLHEMDSALVHEIDCIVELGKQGALVRFLGNEINDRWVSLEEMEHQGLADLLADFRDGT